jgi:mannose-1-phosphate guanylyltransferase
MVFVPSDHYIGDLQKYLKCFEVAEKLIKKEGKMMDIAMTAHFPSTVLGYTHVGDKYLEEEGVEVYQFKGHKEKPDFATAKQYLAEGNYWWHCNYYMWTPAKFLTAYQKYVPKTYEHLMKIKAALLAGDQNQLKLEYSQLEKISIDYAVTEKMDPNDVLIIKGDFGWSDIGAWDILFDKLSGESDENKNLVKAHWVGVDTSGSLVYGPANKIIATIGVDDLVIIDTPDALLICPHSRAQDVKKIVEELKAAGKEHLL